MWECGLPSRALFYSTIFTVTRKLGYPVPRIHPDGMQTQTSSLGRMAARTAKRLASPNSVLSCGMDGSSVAPFLKNKRRRRYLGDDLASKLEDFPSISDPIHKSYRLIRELMRRAQNAIDHESYISLLNDIKTTRLKEELFENIQSVRIDLSAENSPHEAKFKTLKKNLHDIRGGALTALCMGIDWMQMLNTEIGKKDVLSIFYLTRDHLKIMRNCFSDLDPEKRAQDMESNYHSTDLLREKWDGFQSEKKRVKLTSHVSLNIACCCLEFSTIDRVIYNLINNAMKYGNGEIVEMTLEGECGDQPENLKVTVSNPISPSQVDTLNQKFGGKWEELFRGGFTTEGSGLGMSICADCVSNAYGIESFEELIAGGYLGAGISGGNYTAWFYWPLVSDLSL